MQVSNDEAAREGDEFEHLARRAPRELASNYQLGAYLHGGSHTQLLYFAIVPPCDWTHCFYAPRNYQAGEPAKGSRSQVASPILFFLPLLLYDRGPFDII